MACGCLRVPCWCFVFLVGCHASPLQDAARIVLGELVEKHKASSWDVLPPGFEVRDANFRCYAQTLLVTLIRDGLSLGWQGIEDIAVSSTPEPFDLQQKLQSRYGLTEEAGSHHDHWYVACHVFGNDRQTPVICERLAAKVSASAGHIAIGYWLLLVRRIFKNPYTFEMVLQYADSVNLWRAPIGQLASHARPLLEFLIARAPDHVVSRLWGPGRPWMFGAEEGSWAQRAVGAAAKFVDTAKRIAFLSADKRVSEEKRAHILELIEDGFVKNIKQDSGLGTKDPGGPYFVKFVQRDCHDFARALRGQGKFDHVRGPNLYAGCAVGPGPELMFVTFLFCMKKKKEREGCTSKAYCCRETISAALCVAVFIDADGHGRGTGVDVAACPLVPIGPL